MAEALMLEFTGRGRAEYDAVNHKLRIDMASGERDWPDGLLMHAAGIAEHGAFVVNEVWSSREAQAAFIETRLGAALAAAGVTSAPTVTWIPLGAYHNVGALTIGPVRRPRLLGLDLEGVGDRADLPIWALGDYANRCRSCVQISVVRGRCRDRVRLG